MANEFGNSTMASFESAGGSFEVNRAFIKDENARRAARRDSVDFSMAVPDPRWAEQYNEKGLSGNVAFPSKSNKSISRLDISDPNLLLAAMKNAPMEMDSFGGLWDKTDTTFYLKYTDGDGYIGTRPVGIEELLNDPLTTTEAFVMLDLDPTQKVPTGTWTVNFVNPNLAEGGAAITFDLHEWQANVAAGVVYDAIKELRNAKVTLDEARGIGATESMQYIDPSAPDETLRFFESRKDAILDDLELRIDAIDELAESIDKAQLDSEKAAFYLYARNTMNKLWDDFEKNVPFEANTPEGQAVKERIRVRLEEICEGTCIEYNRIVDEAFERNGRVVDRNLIQTIREAGKSLLAKFKEVAKDFLDKAKDVLTKERVIFVRDGAEDIQMDVSKKDFSTLKELAAKAKESAPEERASALERLKNKINELADKANGEIREHGKSLRESVFAKLAAAKAKVQEGVQKFADGMDKVGGYIANSMDKLGNTVSRVVGLGKSALDHKNFVAALGSEAVYNKASGFAEKLRYVPKSDKEILAQLVQRNDEIIGDKPLSEWMKDPNAKVELLSTVPIYELGQPKREETAQISASIFITDLKGNDIDNAAVELSSEEQTNILADVERHRIGEKAVVITEIADTLKGTQYTKENADKWVSQLKKFAYSDLNRLANHLGSVETRALENHLSTAERRGSVEKAFEKEFNKLKNKNIDRD